jgi:hypothetical protein
MPKIGKLVLIEASWLVVALAVGAYFWMLVASHDDERTDAYWTTYGHPPPPGTFWSPEDLMPVFLFGPGVVSVLIRLLRIGIWRRPHAPA